MSAEGRSGGWGRRLLQRLEHAGLDVVDRSAPVDRAHQPLFTIVVKDRGRLLKIDLNAVCDDARLVVPTVNQSIATGRTRAIGRQVLEIDVEGPLAASA